MTSYKQLTLAVGMILSLLSLSAYAQSAEQQQNHFSLDGISFDYPAGYSVSDESTTEAQQFVITRKGSSVQLRIVAPRDLVLRNKLTTATENLTEPLVKKVALTFGRANSPGRTSIQTSVGARQAEGVRLRSAVKGNRTAEVIWLRLSLRLVAMAFVRSDADETAGAELWQTVRSSLRVKAPVITGTKADGEVKPEDAIQGAVLNGSASALPKPDYPPLARAAHASGTVVVQVLIDEEGKVVSAHAVSGHPLLLPVSIAAARKAQFSPTLLEGEPVRVTGVIHYNFVAR